MVFCFFSLVLPQNTFGNSPPARDYAVKTRSNKKFWKWFKFSGKFFFKMISIKDFLLKFCKEKCIAFGILSKSRKNIGILSDLA